MATTTAMPWPLTTLVPMKQIFGVSSGPIPPRAVAMADFSATLPSASYFSTGMDSPVRIAWLTNRSFDDNSRTSAGIMSPAPRWTMSPGTRSAIGISRRVGGADSLSRRITVAVVRTKAFSASAARVERNSCQKRRMTLMTIIVPMMSGPFSSSGSRISEIAASAARIRMNGFLNVASSWRSQCGCFSCATSLGPSAASRVAASASVRPCSDVSSRRNVV